MLFRKILFVTEKFQSFSLMKLDRNNDVASLDSLEFRGITYQMELDGIIRNITYPYS